MMCLCLYPFAGPAYLWAVRPDRYGCERFNITPKSIEGIFMSTDTQTPVANAAQTLIQRLEAKLSEYDMHVLCDITGSMEQPVRSNNPSGPSRWAYAQETLRDFCKLACKIDDDGIALGFFGGNKFPMYENVTADKIDGLLNSQTVGGGTYLAPALNAMFAIAEKATKKDLIIVFLDGEVSDAEATMQALIAKANAQTNDNDCTVLFIQVGDDASATKFLNTLDDGLQAKGAKFDIVDVKTIDEAAQYSSFAELLANAIVD